MNYDSDATIAELRATIQELGKEYRLLHQIADLQGRRIAAVKQMVDEYRLYPSCAWWSAAVLAELDGTA